MKKGIVFNPSMYRIADFSVKLFQNVFSGSTNTLISPTSLLAALAMAQYGARGLTQLELETVLGADADQIGDGQFVVHHKDLYHSITSEISCPEHGALCGHILSMQERRVPMCAIAGILNLTASPETVQAMLENELAGCSNRAALTAFTGTYSSLSPAELPQGEGYYTLIEGEWKPVTEAVTLGAFRFFLKVDSRSGVAAAEARSIRMRIIGENGEDDATGIDNLESLDNDGKTTVIYDLQGRKVLNTETVQEGVYIINGKKVVIK